MEKRIKKLEECQKRTTDALCKSFSDLSESIEILTTRIFDLEEKERDRERIEYQKEMALVSKDLDAMENDSYYFGD